MLEMSEPSSKKNSKVVDSELVKLCQDKLERHDGFLKSKAGFETLYALMAAETLEAEVTPKGGGRKEPQITKHLSQVLDVICESIGAVGASQKQYDRKWLGTAGRQLVAEGDTFSFAQIKPDFTLCDEYSEAASDKEKKDLEVLWRHRMAFVQLKATASQGPKPVKDGAVKEIVAQAADYARLHLSARPFQLFSIGLLIFGRQFCVAIFDRDGIQFSPIYDLWDNLDILIRIIRRMSHEMSPVDFGQDPNIQILHLNDPISVACRTRAMQLANEDPNLIHKIPTYPTYSIDFCGLKYYTIGLPVWNSLSLLGRGTSIWKVTASSAYLTAKGPIFVLKTAWRQSKRPSESAILQRVQGSHDGLVKYSKGTDVYFPSSDVTTTPPKITTANLRNLNTHVEGDTTAVLHRLLFETIGRPIWDFDSYLEFFLAIKAALAAHKFLADQQILHRDISAGNVLLYSDPKAPDSQKGFLTDLEFAWIDDVTLEIRNITVPNSASSCPNQSSVPPIRTHTTWTSPGHGAALTGTTQFMACELVWSVIFHSPVRHQVYHDVESFVWVMYYAIFRRIGFVERSIKEGNVTPLLIQRSQATFKTMFGHADPEAIFRTRENIQRPSSIFGPLHATLLPKPVHTFFEDIPNYINATVRPSKEPGIEYGRCTHEALFGILDKVTAALKASHEEGNDQERADHAQL